MPHTHNREPLLRDDEPILPRLSTSNARTLGAMIITCATVIGSGIGTGYIMQHQLSDLSIRMVRTEAKNAWQDSILIEINGERRRAAYPPVKPSAVVTRSTSIDSGTRRTLVHCEPARRDCTAVDIAGDIPFDPFADPPASGGGVWENLDTLRTQSSDPSTNP